MAQLDPSRWGFGELSSVYILFLCLVSFLHASYVHLLVAYFTSCHHCSAVWMSDSIQEAYIDTAFFLSQLEGCQLLKTSISHKPELLQVTFENTTLQYYSQQSWSRCQYFAQKVLYQLQVTGVGKNLSSPNNVTIQVHGTNTTPDNVTDITTNKPGTNFSLFVLFVLCSKACLWTTCWCRLSITWILRSIPTFFSHSTLANLWPRVWARSAVHIWRHKADAYLDEYAWLSCSARFWWRSLWLVWSRGVS